MLGALPTGKNALFGLGVILLVLLLALVQIYEISGKQTLKAKQVVLISKFAPAILLLTLLTFLSGGSFITKDMSPVGLTWWKLPAEVIVVQILLLVFGVYLPHFIKLLLHRSDAKSVAI